MGNDVAVLDGRSSHELVSAEGLFDADGYRTLTSDVVAHLVFTHQAGMTNLLTRASWEARAADPLLHAPFTASPGEESLIAMMMKGVASEVVDHLLFIDEAKLTERVRGGSGFAERFSAIGPRDRKGRSLHELDLNRRIMSYPCSYLIYSQAFDALPPGAKDPIYRRLWEVLSGQERESATGRRYHSRTVNPSSRSSGTPRKIFPSIFKTPSGSVILSRRPSVGSVPDKRGGWAARFRTSQSGGAGFDQRSSPLEA